MKDFFLSALDEVKRYGSYSLPIINYSLEQDLTLQKKDFLLSLTHGYAGEYKEALRIIGRRLRTKPGKPVFYLLTMNRLTYLRILGKTERANAIYRSLRNNIKDIPEKVRDFIIDELVGHCALLKLSKNCLGRFSRDGRYLGVSGKIFLDINVGRNLIRNGSTEGFKYFRDAFDLAFEIPHPTGMISALNSIAWNGMDYDTELAVRSVRKALYYLGYYQEISKFFYVFDTAFAVMKKSGDPSLFEVSKDLLDLYEKLSPDMKRTFKKTSIEAKKLLESSEYVIDRKTAGFIKKLVKSRDSVGVSDAEIRNIANGKITKMRGETVRKIIAHTDLERNAESGRTPEAFLLEFAKRKEGILDGMDSVMTGMPKSLDPYVEARRDLEREFLQRMPKQIRKRFTDIYMKMNAEEKAIADRFARDYVRYDRKWETRIKLPESMRECVAFFRFKKTPVAFAYYALDASSERNRLLEVLAKFENR